MKNILVLTIIIYLRNLLFGSHFTVKSEKIYLLKYMTYILGYSHLHLL